MSEEQAASAATPVAERPGAAMARKLELRGWLVEKLAHGLENSADVDAVAKDPARGEVRLVSVQHGGRRYRVTVGVSEEAAWRDS